MAAEAKVIKVFLSRKKEADDSREGTPLTLAVKGRVAVDAAALAALQAKFKEGGGDAEDYIFEAAEVQRVPALGAAADDAEGCAAAAAGRLSARRGHRGLRYCSRR